ncbi:MAG TPA: hypothetical protein VL995_05410 [Cellvibrio sp.]|nr:hypothetical protein [Cellvibrio sp.]
MHRKLMAIALFVASLEVTADPATYDETWQWNKNVSITKLQTHWDSISTKLVLSNGEVCRINKEDKELFSIALAMKAQAAVGEVVCQITPISGAERRVHRITM